MRTLFHFENSTSTITRIRKSSQPELFRAANAWIIKKWIRLLKSFNCVDKTVYLARKRPKKAFSLCDLPKYIFVCQWAQGKDLSLYALLCLPKRGCVRRLRSLDIDFDYKNCLRFSFHSGEGKCKGRVTSIDDDFAHFPKSWAKSPSN